MYKGDQPPPYSADNSETPGIHNTTSSTPLYPAPPPYHAFPPGYQPHTTPAFNDGVPSYGSIPVHNDTNTTYIIPQQILVVGGCPACRVGFVEEDFTCLGILCAILFFPIGILCCLAFKSSRCSLCGAHFG